VHGHHLTASRTPSYNKQYTFGTSCHLVSKTINTNKREVFIAQTNNSTALNSFYRASCFCSYGIYAERHFAIYGSPSDINCIGQTWAPNIRCTPLLRWVIRSPSSTDTKLDNRNPSHNITFHLSSFGSQRLGITMAKHKKKHASPPPAASASGPKFAVDLKDNTNLGYKLRVLLYDLQNMAKDRASESRTLATTHPTYISGPYFTPDEAIVVLNATVIVTDEDEKQEAGEQPPDGAIQLEDEGEQQEDGEQPPTEPIKEAPSCQEMTVEEAIQTRLANFFEKKKASSDARPCGPHDMAPIYEGLFGISKEELQNDEKFPSRLRRCGIEG